MRAKLGVTFFLYLVLISCQNEQANNNLELPATWPKIDSSRFDFQLTPSWINLGKLLFFDPILSNDSSISCSSCHLPQFAFATPNAIAIGIKGKKTRRNAAALFNLAFHPVFFSDGGTPTLPMQALSPLTDPHEMANDLQSLMLKLEKNKIWENRFIAVTGQKPILSNLTRAIAAYELSLVSAQSPFDLGAANEVAYKAGFSVFQQHCSTCHAPPLFTNFAFENIGLDIYYTDPGRMMISGAVQDSGKFKVPTLRNWAFTAPYMHDGRFETINQVLDFYQNGGKPHKNQSPLVAKIRFTNQEKAELLLFLTTLNDSIFVNRHSLKL